MYSTIAHSAIEIEKGQLCILSIFFLQIHSESTNFRNFNVKIELSVQFQGKSKNLKCFTSCFKIKIRGPEHSVPALRRQSGRSL